MSPYELDIDKWISKFPLSDAPSVAEWPNTVSPRGIAYREQFRAAVAAQYGDLGRTVPTDVFVFGEGEPDRRDMTKVGGAPYRPSNKQWPLSPSGNPMTFLVQYRFAESRDIAGELPGDILLVFILDDDPWQGSPPEQFAYEWYPLDLNDLISPTDVPPPYWKFFTGYGVRHRTVAYVDPPPDDFWAEVYPEELLNSYPRCLAVDDLCKISGVKIGGVPYWWHPEYISPEGGYELPGRFLCSLSDLGPPDDNDPWINHPAPISFETMRAERRYLDFADGFVINYFLDDCNQIHRGFQPCG